MKIYSEFQKDPEKIGINSKPKERSEEELQVFQELVTLKENLKYYAESTDFLRDCIDTYMIMKRQRDREILTDYLVNNLIKYISKCRYNVGELHEKYLIYERNFLDKVMNFF